MSTGNQNQFSQNLNIFKSIKGKKGSNMGIISITNGQNAGANGQNPNIVNINTHLNTAAAGHSSGLKNSKHHPTMTNNSMVPNTHCSS